MADYNNEICSGCPYHNNKHLNGTAHARRKGVPLSLELGNNANILIVLQAPGEEEWKKGNPLQPTIKIGGTAGSRIKQSWERTGKQRSFFDITNTVQCFPGKDSSGRDKKPSLQATRKCYQWLKQDIEKKEYVKIIAFGRIAQQQVEGAVIELGKNIPVINLAHPSGGLNNSELDSAWD